MKNPHENFLGTPLHSPAYTDYLLLKATKIV